MERRIKKEVIIGWNVVVWICVVDATCLVAFCYCSGVGNETWIYPYETKFQDDSLLMNSRFITGITTSGLVPDNAKKNEKERQNQNEKQVKNRIESQSVRMKQKCHK